MLEGTVKRPRLFGTDGIRAEVGTGPLVPEFVLRLGLAAGSVFDENDRVNTIVVGRDTRRSGLMLQSALTAGLLARGTTVVDAGVITTPGVAYLVRRLGATAGVVISASHNPVHENGIKFFDRDGLKLSEAIEYEMEQRLESSETERAFNQFGRVIDGQGMHELYVENLLDEHRDLRLNSLSLVVDCANGAASWFAPECLARLGARVIAIHASPTGVNINDCAGSEYVRRRPQEMGHLVRQYGASFGLAFDGDADRVVFIDEQDQVIDGDYMLAILARYFDARHQLATRAIVTTQMRNEGLIEFAHGHQLEVYSMPVGDKYVVDKLIELGSRASSHQYGLGGEQAGHIVLMDKNHTTGDGIRTALFIIRPFVESGAHSLTELTGVIQKTPQVIASAYVGAGPRFDHSALVNLESEARQALPTLKRVNLRYSGTEPQFRAMLDTDAETPESMLSKVAWDVCRKVQALAGFDDGFLEILNCARGGVLAPPRAETLDTH
jgi:phosphoglucosamine mutase